MASPLTHAAIGYALFRMARPWFHVLKGRRQVGVLLAAAIGVSLLPDADAAIGILLGDLGRYHNQFSHSLAMGLPAALVTGIVGWLCVRHGFMRWLTIGGVAYTLHVLIDCVTYGRGVQLLWPLTSQRFLSPLLLFYGLHWSDGMISSKHLITLASELPVILLLVWWVHRPRRGIASANEMP